MLRILEMNIYVQYNCAELNSMNHVTHQMIKCYLFEKGVKIKSNTIDAWYYIGGFDDDPFAYTSLFAH